MGVGQGEIKGMVMEECKCSCTLEVRVSTGRDSRAPACQEKQNGREGKAGMVID